LRLHQTNAYSQLYEPCTNIDAGARYLREMLDRFSGNIHLALAAYNAGERHASVWLASGKDDELLWKETREYIPAVLKLYDHYLAQTM